MERPFKKPGSRIREQRGGGLDFATYQRRYVDTQARTAVDGCVVKQPWCLRRHNLYGRVRKGVATRFNSTEAPPSVRGS